MSAGREIDGWYVGRCTTGWIIGRRSRGQHYPVYLNSEVMRFDSVAKAIRYLRALLTPTMADRSYRRRDLRIEILTTH